MAAPLAVDSSWKQNAMYFHACPRWLSRNEILHSCEYSTSAASLGIEHERSVFAPIARTNFSNNSSNIEELFTNRRTSYLINGSKSKEYVTVLLGTPYATTFITFTKPKVKF